MKQTKRIMTERGAGGKAWLLGRQKVYIASYPFDIL
jgi:hypothetical protein